MFKKLNIKALLIILLILVGVVIIINLTGKKERTFRSKVIEFDSGLITEMKVYNPKNPDIIIVNMPEDGIWEVSSGEKTYYADKAALENMMLMLADMKTLRIAATSEDKWEDYHVTEETAVRVELIQDDDVIGDLMIGKFSYKMQEQTDPMQQQKATMTSYLRHVDEDAVYAVEGIIRMNFTSGIVFYRKKELVGINKDEINKVSFNYPDHSFSIERSGNSWMLGQQPLDSLKTARFIRSLSTLRSSEFADIDTPASKAEMSIRIEGIGFDPIDIYAYPAADTAVKYYVTSSLNPGTVYDGEKGKLIEKNFVREDRFLPKQ